MAVYTPLAGAGVQGLSSQVQRLIVEVLSYGPGYSTGRAAPQNYYHLGLLRLGVQGSYYPSVPIDGASILLDLPVGVNLLGYSLEPGTSISVTEVFEVFAPFPPGAVRVPNMFANVSLTPGSGSHTLLTYTVPSGKSSLLEYVWAGASIGDQTQTMAVSVTLSGSDLYRVFITGYATAPGSNQWDVLGPANPQLHLFAGDVVTVTATLASGTLAGIFHATLGILEYPQPMW